MELVNVEEPGVVPGSLLAHSRPPGYRRIKKSERKIDAHVEWVLGAVENWSDCG